MKTNLVMLQESKFLSTPIIELPHVRYLQDIDFQHFGALVKKKFRVKIIGRVLGS